MDNSNVQYFNNILLDIRYKVASKFHHRFNMTIDTILRGFTISEASKRLSISYSLESLNLSLQLEFPQAPPGSPNHQPDRRGYIQHHGVLHRLPDNLCHLHYVVTSHFVDEFIMELQSKRRTTGGPLLPPSTPLERFPVRPGQPQPFLHFNHGSLHQVSSRALHLVTHKK